MYACYDKWLIYHGLGLTLISLNKTVLIKALLSFLCLFVMGYCVKATNYEPAYIILKQDTLHGFIDRTAEVELSKKVLFKKDLSATVPVQYSPQELSEIRFKSDSVVFEAVEAEIRIGADIYKTMRFAKLMLKGYTNLYKLYLPVEERNVSVFTNNIYVYVVKKEEKFFTIAEYENKVDNLYRVDKRYQRVLSYIFSDCNQPEVKRKLTKMIEQLRLIDKEIIAIISVYNACKAPGASEYILKYKVLPIVKHGIDASHVRLLTFPYAYVASSNGFGAGYFWDIIRPEFSTRFSSQVGIYYQYLTAAYQSSIIINEPVEHIFMHSLKVPFWGQYNFNNNLKAKYQPYINLGITNELLGRLPIINLHAGAGIYTGKVRCAVSFENAGAYAGYKMNTVLFSIGYRLDKN